MKVQNCLGSEAIWKFVFDKYLRVIAIKCVRVSLHQVSESYPALNYAVIVSKEQGVTPLREEDSHLEPLFR